MKKHIKIKDEPSFVRDQHSNAIINKNSDAFMAYKKRKQNNKQLYDEVSTLKNEIYEIKKILLNLELKTNDNS